MMTVSDLTDAELLRRYEQLQTDLARKWWNDPVGWVNEHVDFDDGGLTGYQTNELARLAEHGRLAVRGPRGSGKTMPAALVFWWFACTRELAKADWKIPTTAGSWPQITVYLWPEIHKWARRIRWEKVGLRKPGAQVLLRHQLKWGHGEAFGRAVTDPELIEGAHADNILVIIDEAKAVSDAVFDAIEGFFSNPGDHYAYVLSTPGAATGRFYDIHTQQPGYEEWDAIHVTIQEAIDAGRVSQEWVDARRRQWGEDSRMFRCHVLAEFAGEEDGVIPMGWIEAAVERGRGFKPPNTIPQVGVDVADTGDDATVIAYCSDAGCWGTEELRADDVVAVADMVQTRTQKSTRVVVDSIGVGAGTLAACTNLGLNATGFVASRKSKRKDATGTFGFTNLRAAAWWNLRELLDPTNPNPIVLPDDPQVLGDLSAPKWREAAGGRITIESKADIAKRLHRSTDHGDAIVMGMWRGGKSPAKGWADNVAV